MYYIVYITIFTAIVFFVFKFIKNLFKASKRDYTFDSVKAKAVLSALNKKQYKNAEELISDLNPDDINHVFDCIGFDLTEKQIQEWLNSTLQNDFPNLALGSFYYLKSVKARTHQVSDKLSNNQISLFFDFSEKAIQVLEQVKGLLYSEAQSRLIAVNRGIDKRDNAIENFKNAKKNSKETLWTYIHYLEMILPKWGGSQEEINDFMKELPKDNLSQSILKLKLAYDAENDDENYIDNEQLAVHSLEEIFKKIDQENFQGLSTNINRYVLFGYMYASSLILKNKKLELKYKKLMNGCFTLFPFGIM